MSNIEKLQRSHRYPTLRVEAEPRARRHWLYMHADAGTGIRPCFRTELLDEMWRYLSSHHAARSRSASPATCATSCSPRTPPRSTSAATSNCSRA